MIIESNFVLWPLFRKRYKLAQMEQSQILLHGAAAWGSGLAALDDSAPDQRLANMCLRPVSCGRFVHAVARH